MAAEEWDGMHEYAGDARGRLLLTRREALSDTWHRGPRLEYLTGSIGNYGMLL